MISRRRMSAIVPQHHRPIVMLHQAGCRACPRLAEQRCAKQSWRDQPVALRPRSGPAVRLEASVARVRRQRRPRSVHSGRMGCVIEPRNRLLAGAEIVFVIERNGQCRREALSILPGSKSTSRAKGARPVPLWPAAPRFVGAIDRAEPVILALIRRPVRHGARRGAR